MGLIQDFFKSFSAGGAQVTTGIQSIARTGTVSPSPNVVQQRRIESKYAQTRSNIVTSVQQLRRIDQVRFVERQAIKIDQAIKIEAKKHIPTLKDIQMAGYKYGQSNPHAAKMIYNSGDYGAKIVKKAIPKNIGVPTGKAMFAFSDGAIKGVRNEPVKTLAFLALPGAVGAVGKGARYVPLAKNLVKSEKAMKAASRFFDIAYSHNVYKRVNAPMLDYYKDGKILSEKSKTLPDGSVQIIQEIEQIPVTRKPTVDEKAERLGYIFSTEAGPMVFGQMGINKVSKTRFKELSKKGVQTIKTKTKKLSKAEATRNKKQSTLKNDIIEARKIAAKRITKKAEKEFRIRKATQPVKAFQSKISAIKSRYNKVLKEKLPPRQVRLFKKIRVKQMELIFENNPTKRMNLQKELKNLEHKITKEVTRKTIIKRIIDQNRRFLRDESAITGKISTRDIPEIADVKMSRRLADIEKKELQSLRTLRVREIEVTKSARKVQTISSQEYIKPLTERLNKIEISTGVRVGETPKHVMKVSTISDLPSGKIKIPALEKQLGTKTKIPQPLKKQIEAIKTEVKKFNKTTDELKTNIVNLEKLKTKAKIIKNKKLNARYLKKTHAVETQIKTLIKRRNKLSIRIIGKIKTYRNSNVYRRYRSSIKPKIKPKIKAEVKPEMKPKNLIGVKTKSKSDVKPKTKVEVKPKTKVEVKPKTKVEVKPVPLIPPKKKTVTKKKRKPRKGTAKVYKMKNPIPTLRGFLK